MEQQTPITTDMLASPNKRFANFVADNFVTTLLQMGLAEAGNRLYAIYGTKGFLVGPPVFGNVKFVIMSIAVTIIYFGLFESLNARTVGKYITNTMVVNRDGTQPDNTRIFLRTLCRLIPLEILTFIGPVPMGLHDRLSKTVVVDIKQLKKAGAAKNAANDN